MRQFVLQVGPKIINKRSRNFLIYINKKDPKTPTKFEALILSAYLV